MICSAVWSNEINLNLSEYYFGTTSKAIYHNFESSLYGFKKLSYSFLNYKKPDSTTDILQTSYMSFIETMLTTFEVGTCLGYERKGNKVVPILGDPTNNQSKELINWQNNIIENFAEIYNYLIHSSDSFEEFEEKTKHKLLKQYLNPKFNDLPEWTKEPLFDMGWGDDKKVSVVNWKNIFNRDLKRQSYWFQGSLAQTRLPLSYLYNFLVFLINKEPKLKNIIKRILLMKIIT